MLGSNQSRRPKQQPLDTEQRQPLLQQQQWQEGAAAQCVAQDQGVPYGDLPDVVKRSRTDLSAPPAALQTEALGLSGPLVPAAGGDRVEAIGSGVVVSNQQGHTIKLSVSDATMQRAVYALEQFTK
jgi:hypothetical protein